MIFTAVLAKHYDPAEDISHEKAMYLLRPFVNSGLKAFGDYNICILLMDTPVSTLISILRAIHVDINSKDLRY